MSDIIIGIYRIINLANGKVYVGKSGNILERWNNHRKDLRSNKKRPNEHLQNSWNLYGKENFVFMVIEECSLEQLKEKEEYYINLFESYKSEKGYNIKKISSGLERHSEETKKKISEANKGKTVSEKTRYLMSLASSGRKWTEEQKRNLSEVRKNNYENSNLCELNKTYKGENNPNSKLTVQEIVEIREKFKSGRRKASLAREYKVGWSTIHRVVNRIHWDI